MAKYDWNALKKEFVTSDVITLSAFFLEKSISENNWKHKCKGWLEERHEFRTKQTQKYFDRQAKTLARRIRIGRVLQLRSVRQLTSEKLKNASVSEVNGVLRTGFDIENHALGMQQPKFKGGAELTVDFTGEKADGLRITGRVIAEGD